MPQVNFQINSKTYPISCKEGQEERLMQLQSLISKKEAEIFQAFHGNITHEMLLVMLSIVLSDELTAAKEQIKPSEPTAPQLDPREVENLNEKIQNLKDKIDIMSLKI